MNGFRFTYMLPAMLCMAGVLATAQENPAQMNPTPVQTSGQENGQSGNSQQAPAMRQGTRPFRTNNMGGRLGQVTEVAPDHLMIKTLANEVIRVNVLDRTRVIDGTVRQRTTGEIAPPAAGQQVQPGPVPMNGYVPATIKVTDIAVGDYVTSVGEMPPGEGIINASMISKMDPERVKQLKAQQAEFGKTWLMGRVTAVEGGKVTLTGSTDNASHSFVVAADASVTVRRRPASVEDIQVGGMIRAEGELVNGVFTAKTVMVLSGGRMGGPNGGQFAPNSSPMDGHGWQQPPQSAAPQQSTPSPVPAPQN